MGSDHSVWSCTKPVDMLTRTYLNLEEEEVRVTFIEPVHSATGNRSGEDHGEGFQEAATRCGRVNRRMLDLTTYPLDPSPAW